MYIVYKIRITDSDTPTARGVGGLNKTRGGYTHRGGCAEYVIKCARTDVRFQRNRQEPSGKHVFPSNVGGVEPSDGSIGTDVFYHKSSHSGSFSVTTPGLLYNTK